MSKIKFKAEVLKNGVEGEKPILFLRLPQNESDKLPSRGLVMVEGEVGGAPFKAPLEPDGKRSHLLLIDSKLQKASKALQGQTVQVELQTTDQWVEPVVPSDLKKALEADPKSLATWRDITPLARWDWIRWVNGAKQDQTRARRIDSLASRFRAGKRRPCCFNRNECSLPGVWD